MKEFLKPYRKWIVTLLFPYLYLMFFLVVPTDFSVHAPGGINEVGPIVAIEDHEMSDAFYTIFIYHWTPLTAFQRMVLTVDRTMTVYPRTLREKDTSYRDDFLAGQLAKQVSLMTSVILAYELASEKDQTVRIDYQLEGVYVYQRPRRLQELKIGDRVVEVNGVSYQDDLDAFYQALGNDAMNLTIIRETDGIETTHELMIQLEPGDLSIRYLPSYRIKHAVPKVDLPASDYKSGGPSGGLIQTLSIYASLLKINIDQHRIAGTGSVSMDGNVGRIGAVRQKIYTGIDQKIDVFFIPESHYNEVKDIRIPYQLIRVKTVREAVEWLYETYR